MFLFCFLFPLLIVFSVCAPVWSPCSPNMSMRVLPGTLYHWQFVSNLKECKENCNLMMHQIFHGYMWKYQISSLNSSFQVAAFLCGIYCGCLNKIALLFLILRLELPETVLIFHVLRFLWWSECLIFWNVALCRFLRGWFYIVYYFHLQCRPVMDAFRKYVQLWSSAFCLIFDYVLRILLCCR